ncbi:DUF883 family protein [Ramlibacter humi]|uniref:DUF883 family protein n=1 Tax=Ramlibacter humi TaxID=2530451 RepID=A0A4Z0BZH4_9BURK|nr:DUF883 family protein [Ramlibacter humi]TFZ03934.1 hypothetical protein EZ216_09855 [Ramlibacter humi]
MAQDTLTARAGAAAHSLADDAMDRVRDLRSSAQDYANRGMSAVGDGAQVARDRLGRYANATGRYVTEEPVKTALIAAAVGAAIAAIVMVARSRRDRYYY